MRREERVTVQGPVKKQQPDGMSHRGGTRPSLALTPAATFYDTCRHLPDLFHDLCDVYVCRGQCVLPSVIALCWLHGVTGTLNHFSHMQSVIHQSQIQFLFFAEHGLVFPYM